MTVTEKKLLNQLSALKSAIAATNTDLYLLATLTPVDDPNIASIKMRIENRLKALSTLNFNE